MHQILLEGVEKMRPATGRLVKRMFKKQLAPQSLFQSFLHPGRILELCSQEREESFSELGGTRPSWDLGTVLKTMQWQSTDLLNVQTSALFHIYSTPRGWQPDRGLEESSLGIVIKEKTLKILTSEVPKERSPSSYPTVKTRFNKPLLVPRASKQLHVKIKSNHQIEWRKWRRRNHQWNNSRKFPTYERHESQV